MSEEAVLRRTLNDYAEAVEQRQAALAATEDLLARVLLVQNAVLLDLVRGQEDGEGVDPEALRRHRDHLEVVGAALKRLVVDGVS